MGYGNGEGRRFEVPKKLPERFVLRSSPSIDEIVNAQEAGQEISFELIEGLDDDAKTREIRGVPLGVQQLNERDEGTFLILLDLGNHRLLLTYSPIDNLLSTELSSRTSWDQLIRQYQVQE